MARSLTCQDLHRSREFVKFLNHVEKNVPVDQDMHLVMDNYRSHKSAEVQRWLQPKTRRRFHFHFTPTSSSWLNQVERFFALLTGRMSRRGTFTALTNWSRPSTNGWRTGTRHLNRSLEASADVILDKVRRCKELSKTGD